MTHVAIANLAVRPSGRRPAVRQRRVPVSAGDTSGWSAPTASARPPCCASSQARSRPTRARSRSAAASPTCAQDVGDSGEQTVRDLLLSHRRGAAAARRARDGRRRARAGRGRRRRGHELGAAIGDWSELGGYELEGQWDAAAGASCARRSPRSAEPPAVTLSGGERKRLVLDVLSVGRAGAPARRARQLPRRAGQARARAADRERRRPSCSSPTTASCCRPPSRSIVTLEGNGAWVHGGSYATYPEARDARQKRLGDAVKRWRDEERRLYKLMKTFKERAKYRPTGPRRPTPWRRAGERYAEAGPPPAPVADQQIRVRIRGGDSARKVVELRGVGIEGLVCRSPTRCTSASGSAWSAPTARARRS